MKLKRIKFVINKVVNNLRKMLAIAWRMDKRLTFAYYSTAAIGALTPLAASLTLKYLIDSILKDQTQALSASIPLIVIIVLAARYFIIVGDNIVQWGLNRTYFVYL